MVTRQHETAAWIARLAATGVRLGVDVQPLLQALPVLGELPHQVWWGLALDGTALGVAAAEPAEPDWMARVGRLGELLGAGPAWPGAVSHPARVRRLELRTTPRAAGLEAALEWYGERGVDDQLAALADVGWTPEVAATFAERLRFLAAGAAQRTARRSAITVGLGATTRIEVAVPLAGAEAELPDAMGRVAVIADELGVGVAERALFERVHPLLAIGGDAELALATSYDGAAWSLSITWDGARWGERDWDTVLRVATGLAPGATTAERLGTWQGAMAVTRVGTVTLRLAAARAPTAWVWAT